MDPSATDLSTSDAYPSSTSLSPSSDLEVSDPVANPTPLEAPTPTFATGAGEFDFHLHNGNRQPEPEPEPEHEDIDKSRQEFLKAIGTQPTRAMSRPRTITRKRTLYRPQSQALTDAEVYDAASALLSGKKVNVTDPVSVAAIMKELDQRRVKLLQESEYLKSKKVGDVMAAFKKQFYLNDQELMFKENRRQLEERLKESKSALDDTTTQWKRKRSQFIESCQKTLDDVQDRHQGEHEQLESKWSAPSTQRRFTKRSAHLLQQKAIEKYMVLAGKLEEAEELKKRNQMTEKKESEQKYKEMSQSFEGARARLLSAQNDQIENVRGTQEFKMRDFMREEKKALDVCQKRVAVIQKDLDDVSDVDKFVAKKFKRTAGCPLPMSFVDGGEDLPPLSRGMGMSRSEANPSVLPMESAPLQLPPLKMKPIKQKKVSVSFK